jgi:hypothetical protein
MFPVALSRYFRLQLVARIIHFDVAQILDSFVVSLRSSVPDVPTSAAHRWLESFTAASRSSAALLMPADAFSII